MRMTLQQPTSPNKTDACDDSLQALWRACSTSGDFTRLITLVDSPSAVTKTCDHDYPSLHRLFDFTAGDRAFRVCRCGACDERVYLSRLPLTEASSEMGVPVELGGAALQSWGSNLAPLLPMANPL